MHLSASQDMFDHDKGQKSAISGRHLCWIFEFPRLILVSFFLQLFHLVAKGGRQKRTNKRATTNVTKNATERKQVNISLISAPHQCKNK